MAVKTWCRSTWKHPYAAVDVDPVQGKEEKWPVLGKEEDID